MFQFPVPVIQIGDAALRVEIADTDQKRARGLSGRPALAANEGMLFVFEEPGRYGFRMKDMSFSIDIIWIGQDKKVVEIMNTIAPETFPETFYPKELVQYVVEVRAGFAKENNVQLGDKVSGL